VLCPEPLYNILTKSKQIRPVEELLGSFEFSANQKVPIEILTPAEHQILTSSLALLGTIADALPPVEIDIYLSDFPKLGSSTPTFGRVSGSKIQISRSLFDPKKVHEHFNRCTTSYKGKKCACVETFLLTTLVSLRAELRFPNPQMQHGYEKLLSERLMTKLVEIALSK